jgi:hypothetical protein
MLPTLALAAALGLPAVAAQAAPAPIATSAVAGPWDERDTHLHFAIRPGANPNQIVVTVPKDLAFPGGHDFVLTRTAPTAFSVKATDERPGLLVIFKSPAEAHLKIAGAGSTKGAHGGAWMMVNDFILKRP